MHIIWSTFVKDLSYKEVEGLPFAIYTDKYPKTEGSQGKCKK